jgi:PEP-CTERM motif
MKNNSLTLSPWGLSLIVALAFVPVANAVVINYQVTQAGSVSPESTLFGPDLHAAGTESWNMDQWSGSTPTVTNMVDSSGVSTGVGITQDGFTGVDDWNISAALTMLHRSASAFGNGPGNAASFTITGLVVGGTYDLFVASAHTSGEAVAKGIGDWSTSNVNATGSSVIMNNTNTLASPNNQTNGATWVLGVNYALFQSVVADSTGKITMTEHAVTPNLTDSRIGFSGFQLISVPEPSAALLGGLGVLALLRRRRA